MSNLIKNTACPICSKSGEGKSLSVYEDGEYCHECGYSTRSQSARFYTGEIKALVSRKLTTEALGKYGVQQFKYTGNLGYGTHYYDEDAVIFNFYESGKIEKQKIRLLVDRSKCTQLGETKSTKLFGMHSFTPSKKIPIVITEGEFDSVAVYQAMNYPAVSICGAGNAVKYIAENLEWLSGWSYVVLCFDNDDAGRDATDKAIGLFEVGKVRIAHLPLKDPNDMVKAEREEELKRCIWNAEIMRPSTIISPLDILDEILEKPALGDPWPYKFMNSVTYGMSPEKFYVLSAAEGIGKTELIKEIIYHFTSNHIKCGIFNFEDGAKTVVQKLIGGVVNKKLYIPANSWWDKEKITEEVKRLNENLHLYNNKGALSLESILLNIRYLAKCHQVKFIVIDNLTALSSMPSVNEKYISELAYTIQVAGALKNLCVELGICIMLVAHVNNDTITKSMHISSKMNNEGYMGLSSDEMNDRINAPGTTWETGRIPTVNNIYCGGALRKLADFVLVLGRNKMSDNEEERCTLKARFLKSRMEKEGEIFNLYYNNQTGRLQDYDEII